MQLGAACVELQAFPVEVALEPIFACSIAHSAKMLDQPPAAPSQAPPLESRPASEVLGLLPPILDEKPDDHFARFEKWTPERLAELENELLARARLPEVKCLPEVRPLLAALLLEYIDIFAPKLDPLTRAKRPPVVIELERPVESMPRFSCGNPKPHDLMVEHMAEYREAGLWRYTEMDERVEAIMPLLPIMQGSLRITQNLKPLNAATKKNRYPISDNLRKGAALNTIQIAECLVNRKLITAKKKAA